MKDMRGMYLTLACIAAVVAAGCTKDKLPRTEVVVSVDAEPGIRAETATLQIIVRGGKDKASLSERDKRTLSAKGSKKIEWPWTFGIIPIKGDADRVYEVVATALDTDGKAVSLVRAISGYVKGKTLLLELLLEDACLDHVCGEGKTCHKGKCGDAWVDPSKLSNYTPEADAGGKGDASGADGSEGVDGAQDASKDSAVDAGVDAVVDAGDGGTQETFTVGGKVSGLAGSGLVLRNNDGDNETIKGNGSFTFATALDDGSSYSVTIYKQPSSSAQTCSVSQGSGKIAGGNVTNVAVTCYMPSCKGLGLNCNDKGTAVSCCDSKLVTGGTFPMGRCGVAGAGCSDAYDGGSDEVPEHNATVADFYLDTFEVTVGRFRKFVEQYDGTPPAVGAGAHPLITGSGWQSGWNSSLPSTKASLISNLKCDASYQTWTDTAGANEQYPNNCVNWYEAFAFCIWDGGRIPTEAEWEYAAAGGSKNQLYPWGSQAGDGNPQRANFNSTAHSPFMDVGNYPAGAGRWGQHDLAGSVFEWVLDCYDSGRYSGGGNTCNNCANLNSASDRTFRGGSWFNDANAMRAAYRWNGNPAVRVYSLGLRCARNP